MLFNLSNFMSALIFSSFISDFSMSSMLHFCFSNLICSSRSSFIFFRLIHDCFGSVVATAVSILIILPSVNTIHFDTDNDIVFFEKINSFSFGVSNGTILIIHGFKDVTIGMWFGNIVMTQLSVGSVICLIFHSNIVFDGLDIFNFISIYYVLKYFYSLFYINNFFYQDL
jgi:hypothetical protein